MKKLFLLFLTVTACAASDPIPTPTPIPQQPKTQWLILASSDTAQPAGLNPVTTYFISKNRVVVRQLPDGSYLITFDP